MICRRIPHEQIHQIHARIHRRFHTYGCAANDPLFIEEFTEWLASLTPDCFEFEGENHYCGFTVQMYKEDPAYSWDTDNHVFEISYSGETDYRSKLVKVYTSNHNGFWVPEYIDLTGEECAEILGIIKNNLEQWGGF